MGKILSWFSGGASSLMPWLVVFGFGITVGTAVTWAGWSLKLEAYKGKEATAKLEAISVAYDKGKKVAEEAAKERDSLREKNTQLVVTVGKVKEVIKNETKNNPALSSSDCAWPVSVRDAYNAIGTSTVPGR